MTLFTSKSPVAPSALTDPFTSLTDLEPLIKHLEQKASKIKERLVFTIAKKHAIKRMEKVLEERFYSYLDWRLIMRTLSSIENEMKRILNQSKTRARAIIHK